MAERELLVSAGAAHSKAEMTAVVRQMEAHQLQAGRWEEDVQMQLDHISTLQRQAGIASLGSTPMSSRTQLPAVSTAAGESHRHGAHSSAPPVKGPDLSGAGILPPGHAASLMPPPQPPASSSQSGITASAGQRDGHKVGIQEGGFGLPLAAPALAKVLPALPSGIPAPAIPSAFTPQADLAVRSDSIPAMEMSMPDFVGSVRAALDQVGLAAGGEERLVSSQWSIGGQSEEMEMADIVGSIPFSTIPGAYK
eukprot:gene13921-16457_t